MQAFAISTGSLVESIVRRELPPDELRHLLHTAGAIVRANALIALTEYAKDDEDLLADFVAAAKEPQNAVRLMGTTSVQHVAVASLLEVGTTAACASATALLDGWPEPDRSDLVWYLKSEGLPSA